MTWPIRDFPVSDRLTFETGRVSGEDATRQLRTVQGLIDRLETRPGVILADEVGMGKTFVALGVALAAAQTDIEQRPVVVMVPSSLFEKWPREFEVFRDLAMLGPERDTIRAKPAATALEFLRMLDDPIERRPRIVFLKHGAFHVQGIDHWVKFALIKRALKGRRVGERRTALPRFAADILRCRSRYGEPELYERLLHVGYERWHTTINYFYRHEPQRQLPDDPIPLAVREVFESETLPLEALCAALWELPARESATIENRLSDVRDEINSALKLLWPRILGAVRFHSPLLILDEAHHLKNPATRLSSLFVKPEAEEDLGVLAGVLSGAFERMLFLTATPFQLGHRELLSVLQRFKGANWNEFPAGARDSYDAEIKELGSKLDLAHARTCELDERWSRLTHEDCGATGVNGAWWSRMLAETEAQTERAQVVVRAYREAQRAMRAAEVDLRRFVVRHLRSRELPNSTIARRLRRVGSGLLVGNESETRGLEVSGDALLPFLLAARAQAIQAQSKEPDGGGLFAEGLASSYEAFAETRRQAHELVDELETRAAKPTSPRLEAYLAKLEQALPTHSDRARHPKVAALVQRVVDLWQRGEKVVVFCHFRKTGLALVRHFSAAIEEQLWRGARERTGLDHEETLKAVQAFSERFDVGAAMRVRLEDWVSQSLRGIGAELPDDSVGRIRDVIARFIRTPLFVARHFDFTARSSEALLLNAFESKDSSGVTLGQTIERFLQFIAIRCNPDERQRYLDALDLVQPGSRIQRPSLDDEHAELERRLLPNVRLAYGKTDADVRQRLMLSFNTPFFPDILVASSVLAEGVDLHLNCRHIIHHDLSWNPSTIEQRTGRVDRIGAKAEYVERSIEVFLPYIGETQDEKQYRVVMDRERWFQVLMGENYRTDDFWTKQLAERVPLPEAAAQALAFDLSVVSSTQA